MTTATSTCLSSPPSIDRIEDFPGYDAAIGCFVEPGETLLDDRCPECGARMLWMPMAGVHPVEDCPWCMNHREPDRHDTEPERLERALIPRRYRSLEPAWTDLPALKGGTSIWLEGKGSGRTSMACRILKAWIRDGGTGMYVIEHDLLNAAPDAIERMRNTGLLVIDGMGTAQDPGEWMLRKLGAVLYQRSSDERPTIITSERSPMDAVAAIGDGGVAEAVRRVAETMRRVAA